MTGTTTSRLARVQDAVRPEMKARLMLAGPAGAGKTRTALAIAAVLAPGAKALVIDTEEESALTYADFYTFKHLPWDPPYDPQELANIVAEASREYPVIIIDSASHFWTDDGGTLDIAGGKFTGWKAARPAQRDLMVAVLRSPAHMIVCVRSKMDHAQELDTNTGKQVVTKLGMAPIQDSTFEYEMNVSAELDMTHKLSISKTRCDVLDGRQFPKGHAEDFAKLYGDWLKGGEPTADQATIDELVARMNAIADEEQRKECKRGFVDRFGRPEHLAASRTADADAHVAAFEADPQPPVDPEPNRAPVPTEPADEPAAAHDTQVGVEAGPTGTATYARCGCGWSSPVFTTRAEADEAAAAHAPPTAANGNHAPPPPAVPVNGHSSRVSGVVISGKLASKLHADVANVAKALGHTKAGAKAGTTVADDGWSEGTLDALVLSATNTRTDQAGEITMAEKGTVERYIAELAAGNMTSTVSDNGNVTLVIDGQSYRFIRTPDDGLIHVGAVAS